MEQIRSARLRIAGLFLILLIFPGCNRDIKENPVAQPRNAGPQETPVDVFITFPQFLERAIQATGTIVPYESLRIKPERPGKLDYLDAPESRYVKKGHLIARINHDELVAQKEKFEISLAYARSELDRGRSLLEIQGITEEEVNQLENQVKTYESEIRILEVQIEKSEIRAPFSGTLGLRQVSPGAYVTPQDVLIDLQQTHKVKLDFDVPEKYLPKVRAGQKVTFGIAGSANAYDAQVYAFSNEISPATRTFKVRAVVENPNGDLKPGQFAKVKLVTGTTDSAILVPTDAVIPVLDGKEVFLVRNGRASVQFVETNLRQADLIELTDGVNLGDTVIVSGLLSIADGARVRAANVINSDKLAD